ncbi:MAG: methyl-accepting chemotaxis protein [Treponema sp.]|jgi:iron only hydrogenase large subunit-like protein|nr:methyl-accepting chemotaxis protein [Treponema sp.]
MFYSKKSTTGMMNFFKTQPVLKKSIDNLSVEVGMQIQELSPVIRVDEEKCVNCHACIAACPVKYCNNGAGEKVIVNHNLCIGCGHCIHACTHQARLRVDDSERFFDALNKKEKIIAVAAPAVVSNFPGLYLNLNGYLKSRGVAAVFDVSFGAELTIFSYIKYIKGKKPSFCIAQPCPAIVTFIEIYHPELLPYLAPADSPMLHIIKMIREYHPEYNDYKIAVLSPCIAKRREFDETRLGDYNVTFNALHEHLEQMGVDLSRFMAEDYDNPPAERAVAFSMPGGLLLTTERDSPGIGRVTRKIEGVHTIYPYLEDVAKTITAGSGKDGELPLLVDCLNCEKGCNGGPGTRNSETPMDKLEAPIWKRRIEMEAKYGGSRSAVKNHKKVSKVLSRYWKPGLYDRSYRDISGNYALKIPNDQELTEVYKSLRKYGPADIYDCNTCGYGNCQSMAVAVFNGLNRPENCHHYNLSLIKEDRGTIDTLNQNLENQVEKSLDFMKGINDLINDLNDQIIRQASAIEESSAAIEEMMATINNTAALAQKRQTAIQELVDNVEQGRVSMRETIDAVGGISRGVEGVGATIKVISNIAANTNLLSMNAAIEAAHAGDAGMGFAVVAGEIRRLSETTRENSRNIAITLTDIIDGIKTTTARSSATDTLISAMAEEINSFAVTMTELINSLGELAIGSREITTALIQLREHAEAIKTGYHGMMDKTRSLEASMKMITRMNENGEAEGSMETRPPSGS